MKNDNGTPATAYSPSQSPNPFDPSRLRLSQDFATTAGVKKAILTIRVDKPNKEHFVRVHPDPDMRLETWVIELKDDRETYLVDPPLVADLAGETTLRAVALFTAVTRQGDVFLWKVSLPGSDGKQLEWHRTLMEAAAMAESKWVRVVANISIGGYEAYEATGNLPEPKWPEMSMEQILSVAFKNRYIDTLNHPVLQRLRGEA
jgi:hypothetical protein